MLLSGLKQKPAASKSPITILVCLAGSEGIKNGQGNAPCAMQFMTPKPRRSDTGRSVQEFSPCVILRQSAKLFPKKYGRRNPITSAKKEKIYAALEMTSHASQVAAALGVSFSTVWRRAEQKGKALTDGRKAKGHKRLSSQQREKIMEIRRAKPAATQLEVAREAGVSRATVSRVTRGHRRRVKISPVV